jgi:hypothetical protein
MAGVVHITEEEAARDFGAIMKHIRLGDEVFVAGRDGIEAVVRLTDSNQAAKATNIDEIIERLKRRKDKQGLAVLDGEFEADVQEARARYNAPLDGSRWD